MLGLLDQIRTPGGNALLADVPFCVDNGRFGKGWPGHDKWWTWLNKHPAEGCLFAVAPDVVGDAEATLAEGATWLPRIRAAGYPVALVGQNGLERLDVPWDSFDVFFIGGDTEWKLGPAARQLAAEAKARGKRVHMGRVNTWNRMQYAHEIGCDTVDGTLLVFGADGNMPRLMKWLSRLR